ncbi:hypothetical protein ACJX0J_025115, partial [Zea mays]
WINDNSLIELPLRTLPKRFHFERFWPHTQGFQEMDYRSLGPVEEWLRKKTKLLKKKNFIHSLGDLWAVDPILDHRVICEDCLGVYLGGPLPYTKARLNDL